MKHGEEEKVKRYLESRFIRTYSVKKVSHPNATYNSFKISMNKDDIDTILERNFWPRGVRCDEWRDPWDERRHSTDVAHQQEEEVISEENSNDVPLTSEITSHS